MLKFCNFIIRWGFYGILLFVPLIFFGDTSELFEFNKLWLTYGLTILIGAAWITKMIVQRKFIFQKTPLDIPILIFLVSQVLSTIFSLDPHVSWWGYYSRFNGGLLSIFTYIFLYYALVSNYKSEDKKDPDGKKFVVNLLKVSLVSGLITSLWGLPSHFGYDPTCWIFRGTFDVACWTNAFQPKARIFSTLGQPDWLAAYLSILIPLAIAFAIHSFKKLKPQHVSSIKYYVSSKFGIHTTYYILLATLFYVDFLYTRSKGSFIALAIACIIFLGGYLFLNKEKTKIKIAALIVLGLFVGFFFAGSPFVQFSKFTFDGIQATITAHKQAKAPAKIAPTPAAQANPITGELGGTDSGKIRLFVWQGAIDAWLHNPLFGTGVETFAFAYYQYRPAGHNLTSEWDYLYNKAHNEYLNYLATTGILGLGSYLAIIGIFLFLIIRHVILNSFQDLKQNKNEMLNQVQHDNLLTLALLTGYITIIVSNFFGFSVVIVNIYFFLIPAFFLIISDSIPHIPDTKYQIQNTSVGVGQKITISLLWIVAFYVIGVLLNYWNADKAYGLGVNLDRANQYQTAFEPLQQAVNSRPGEPMYKDELSANMATLAVGFASQKDTTNANKFAQAAIKLSDEVVADNPHNMTFWKTRVRVMYTLAQLNPKYLTLALEAIEKAHSLAPTDAKITYNLGLLYAQNNQPEKGVSLLQQTIKLKPDYRDAYFALGILLHQQAVDAKNKVIDQQKAKEAEAMMDFILTKLAPGDSAAQDTLKSWGEK